MKIKYILLMIAGAAISLTACKKNNQNPTVNNSTLVGKWNEVKLYSSQTNSSGAVSDTTITAGFSAGDYAQFNNDYTVNISQSAGNPAPGSASPDYISMNTYNYAISGSVITLTFTGAITTPVVLPGDTLIITRTVTKIDANNIVLHVTSSNAPLNSKNPPGLIIDTYYTRAQ
ncbi:lipocalin family protein [Mucilaginibacter sp. X4EP1]|uniref:lipocalin family protein n=1 Tax=Mucilaginibacter sp. X4EP1 TaxID=2723092 RepID=UPI002167468B|nr:lipocalin family protein [Mucilaginibacter sp. X4EP1]MCS3816144.1 hypothetical protein [Mucilaginibacter sp. X4EP1]